MNRASPKVAGPSVPNRWLLPAALLAAVSAGAIGYAWTSGDFERTEARAAQPNFTAAEAIGGPDGIAETDVEQSSGDPVESLLQILRPSNNPIRSGHDLYLELQRWTAADFHAVMANKAARKEVLDRLDKTPAGVFALRGMVGRWLEVDPAAADSALEWAGSSVRGNQFGGYQIMEAVARKQPEVVLKRLKEVRGELGEKLWRKRTPAMEEYQGLYVHLMNSLGELDPAKAERMLDEFPEEHERSYAKRQILYGMAVVDPLRAADAMDKTFASQEALDVWRVIVDEAKKHGLNTLKALESRGTPQQRALVAGAIADIDPEDGARIVSEVLSTKPESIDYSSLRWVADDLARKDPLHAAKWVNSLPDDARVTLFPMVVSNWIPSDPEGAMTWLLENSKLEPADPIRGAAMARDPRAHAFESWLNCDEEAARTWIASQPEEKAAFFEAGFIEFLVQSDRSEEAAKRFVSAALDDPPLAQRVVLELGESDPVGAMDWAVNLPDGSSREIASTLAMRQWCEEDPVAAAGWLEQLPSSELRDRVVLAYASVASNSDALSASEWVSEISDPWRRTRAALAVYRNWNGQDEEAARSWFRNLTGIDPTLKRITLSEFGSMP